MKAHLVVCMVLSYSVFEAGAQSIQSRLSGYKLTDVEFPPLYSNYYFYDWDSVSLHYSDNRTVYSDKSFDNLIFPPDTLMAFVSSDFSYFEYLDYIRPEPFFTADYDVWVNENELAYDQADVFDEFGFHAKQIEKEYNGDNISVISSIFDFDDADNFENEFYDYDENGNLKSYFFIFAVKNGAIYEQDTNYAEYYSYQDNQLSHFERHYFYDTSYYDFEYDSDSHLVSRTIETGYDHQKQEYEYDGNNLFRIRNYFFEDNSWVESDPVEFEYAGNLLSKVTFVHTEDTSMNGYNYYYYNADGLYDSIKKYRYELNALICVSLEKFNYNETGQFEFYTYYSSADSLHPTTYDYDYNEAGQLVSIYRYYQNGPPYAFFTYNEDGTLATREFGTCYYSFDADEEWNGGGNWNHHYTTKYYYDKIAIDPAGSVDNGFYIHVYPNPSTDLIHILIANAEGDIDIEIRDILGRTVFYNADISNENKIVDIDISAYLPGVYFIMADSNVSSSVQAIAVK